MTFHKWILAWMLCTFFVWSVQAQFYVQTLLDDELKMGRVRTIIEDVNNKSLFIKAGIFPNDVFGEVYRILKVSGRDKVTNIKDFTLLDQYASVFGRTMKLDGSYCYYSMRDINVSSKNPDSVGWNYGVLDLEGNQIIDKKIPLKPVNGSVYFCLGLELIKNGEVLLWGVGIPPDRDPAINDPYITWVRLKRDGSFVSGPHFYKPPGVVTWAIPTDATLDIDSTMVMVYDNKKGGIEKYVLKISEDDKIETMVRIPLVTTSTNDEAKLCVTKDGHYLVTNYDKKNIRLPVLTRIDRNKKVLWENAFDLPIGWWGGVYWPNVRDVYTNRIIETKNGDILMCGVISVVDSFYVPALNKYVSAGNSASSFLARFSGSGDVLWAHFMVDIHDSGILNKILLNDMIESFDGNIIVAGDLGVKNSPGTSRPFIMKIGPNGCFDSQCSHVDKWWYFPPDISSTSDNQDTPDRLKVNPNPGSDQVTIVLPDPGNTNHNIRYTVMDLKGQTHIRGVLESINPVINTQFLSSGIYIITLQDNQSKIWQSKWVKM